MKIIIFRTCLAVGTFAGSVQVLVHVSYLSKMQSVNKNVYVLYIFYTDFTHKHVSDLSNMKHVYYK